jgi:hypothetical protein
MEHSGTAFLALLRQTTLEQYPYVVVDDDTFAQRNALLIEQGEQREIPALVLFREGVVLEVATACDEVQRLVFTDVTVSEKRDPVYAEHRL